MAEIYHPNPDICPINAKAQQSGLSSCGHECALSDQDTTCGYAGFEDVEVRVGDPTSRYRLPPEDDMLTQIQRVPLTLFSRPEKTVPLKHRS
jgi:hypothetical protein